MLKNGTLSYWKSQVSLINIRLTQWEICLVLNNRSTLWKIAFHLEIMYDEMQIWLPEVVNFLALWIWEGYKK